MYFSSHSRYRFPLSERKCVEISHPGQVPKAGREPGSRKNVITLNLHWIPDLARLGGLVRNDELGIVTRFSRKKRFTRNWVNSRFLGFIYS